jgi:hypothetical protein
MATNQNDNIVAGSMAGRDLTIANYYPASPSTQIRMLCERLQSEEGDGVGTAIDFIEDLQHFLDKPASEFDRSLGDKLIASDRAELVEFAQEAKERAMKKILRFQSSRTAQEIFVYVLGDLRSRFMNHVRPLIARQATREEVDAAMQEKVIAPVADALGPSPLTLSPDSVLALLFYLAGNCHIKWD